jgi:hypothetical protein
MTQKQNQKESSLVTSVKASLRALGILAFLFGLVMIQQVGSRRDPAQARATKHMGLGGLGAGAGLFFAASLVKSRK